MDEQLTSQPNTQALFGVTGTGFLSARQVTQRSAASAPWSGALTAGYTHPISDSMDRYLRGLYSWKGKCQGDPQSAIDSVKAYGLLIVYAGLRHPDGNGNFRSMRRT